MPEKTAIELATTEELVTELQKRQNFRGVVIWQPNYNGVPETGWHWHSMHCVASVVCSEMFHALTPPQAITVEPGEPASEAVEAAPPAEAA